MGDNPALQRDPRCPVENVSWEHITEPGGFLDRINASDVLTSVAAGDCSLRFRLPTEAEWEYAARGGPHWRDDFAFSGSNDPDAVAWYGRRWDRPTRHWCSFLAGAWVGALRVGRGSCYPALGLTPLPRKLRTSCPCTICPETCGNGARTCARRISRLSRATAAHILGQAGPAPPWRLPPQLGFALSRLVAIWDSTNRPRWMHWFPLGVGAAIASSNLTRVAFAAGQGAAPAE
jgi:hypothetical protein